ncbi:uncharacterized protein K452DRAFT_293933 [Aplosporella prunicola CBS 121167]|uniref:Uncharacterized protein n=1 Tax=Aplosporella prunicola CBS 121167 TaxID=1176127 RepID=A0A6A6BW56_9PEZI|nr:uncharacterized protein K452DRAFT_293933 [Aplosporella prunicola CBS 121167]KAF2147535.1 hypothetical protein K452DRAFT_293933 [Aplosporella prunicola CBS 121167]
MRFNIISALLLLSIGVEAGCKKGIFCGKCNGSSCKVGGINYHCKFGDCDGEEGGDGKYCFSKFNVDGPYICPGAPMYGLRVAQS